MVVPKPIITKEHGSWAVLFVPMAVGAIIGGEFSSRVVLLALSSLFIFLSYVPVHTLLRDWLGTRQGEDKLHAAKFWALVFGGIGVVFAIPLLLEGYWLLLSIGFVGAFFFFGNFFLACSLQKTVVSDLVAMAGLTLTAPSAYYVATRELNQIALTLWLMNFLFFGCGVFYVHMKIRATSLKKSELSWIEKFSVGKMNLVYHIAVIGIVLALTIRHFTPQLAVAAFVPMTLHAIYGTLKLSNKVRFKNLGLLLLAQSVVFALILSFSK